MNRTFRRSCLCLATLALAASSALAQDAATRPAGDPKVDAMLDALHRVGQDMRSLRADVALRTQDNTTGADATQSGTLVLQRRGEGDTRGHVNFDKTQSGKIVRRDRTEFLLDGDWVVDRVYRRPGASEGGNRETHRQIRQPGDKTDLLKLGAGPFPLPIGQPRDAVHRQFVVTPLPEDPVKPGLVGIELTPRETNALGERFKFIRVWTPAGEAMPRVIETTDPNESALRTTTLANVRLNADVGEADFQLERIDDDWTVTREPLAATNATP